MGRIPTQSDENSVAFVEVAESDHATGVLPVRIHCRELGRARTEATTPTLVFLHGGWGYGVYPIDAQVEVLRECVRFVAPDRSGYGKSSRFAGKMATDFHWRAAKEVIAVLDALGIERPVIWGHSDGAVIGAMIGLEAPERIAGLALESFHFYRKKPRSRGFFERFTARPEDLGEETKRLLAADHGEDWPRVVQRNCGAWIRIGDESARPDEDLYRGRLGELRVPTLFVHGALDPRTEPDEMERVRKVVPQAEFYFVNDGQHSPHSEDATSAEVSEALREFLMEGAG
jgi:pimeloyl-ACP methyl ester carboxylesterase